MSMPRPPYDPEIKPILEKLAGQLPNGITAERIQTFRESSRGDNGRFMRSLPGVRVKDFQIPSFDNSLIEISVISPENVQPNSPMIYFAHGGGMILGDRWRGAETLVESMLEHGAVLITVEYRVAPEFPDPTPIEDCFAGLRWAIDNSERLSIDPSRVLTAGRSAGAGLIAGLGLMARDRGGPTIAGQLLIAPMLDDRDQTTSTLQFEQSGRWDRISNRTGWTSLLGDRRGGNEVSVYAAPGRAHNLTGLPPTFIEVGSAEVFRDECIAFASRIWAQGGTAELHVWSGGVHGFEGIAPDSRLAADARSAREGWLRRMLSPNDEKHLRSSSENTITSASHL